jgi:hypothetical protein
LVEMRVDDEEKCFLVGKFEILIPNVRLHC